MRKSITISDLLMLGGAATTLVFSFLGFTSYANAWSRDGLAFATTVPAILALVMLGWYGCELFGVNLPDDILSFTPAQLKATWGISACGIMLSWASISDLSKDTMFWVQLLGTVAMAGGAVAALLNQLTDVVISASDGDGPPPPPPPPPPPSALE